ncbi:hypothetical protein BegalDRAFT_3513 [Beggiatoa alba B18LD]|uniref:Uncharacterized protein n=1 Tax=Beggiatoa alba B18LD TaxID=395493 RepID=I3CL30_9GAMM|nr:hypothetical protein [Beggiatoa alba]EIJ44323.1 hypothetical protein BegalDRAFT_3513 [Beggiatoa alba B18LD]
MKVSLLTAVISILLQTTVAVAETPATTAPTPVSPAAPTAPMMPTIGDNPMMMPQGYMEMMEKRQASWKAVQAEMDKIRQIKDPMERQKQIEAQIDKVQQQMQENHMMMRALRQEQTMMMADDAPSYTPPAYMQPNMPPMMQQNYPAYQPQPYSAYQQPQAMNMPMMGMGNRQQMQQHQQMMEERLSRIEKLLSEKK